MSASKATPQHNEKQTRSQTTQTSLSRTAGIRQTSNVPDSTAVMQRYLGNSFLQSLAGQGLPAEHATTQTSSALVQRQCHCGGTCAACAGKAGMPAGTGVTGPGHALPESARAFFESRLGYDFSGVRVHTDARAAESAQALRASSYTVGQDIVFGEGRFSPDTAPGQRLLAHELTHVVQQGRSGKRPSRAVSSPKDASEVEASRIGSSILSPSESPGAVSIGAEPTAAVQRQEEGQDLEAAMWEEIARRSEQDSPTPFVKTPPTRDLGAEFRRERARAPGSHVSHHSARRRRRFDRSVFEQKDADSSLRFAFGVRRGQRVTEDSLINWAFEKAGEGATFEDLVRRLESSHEFAGGSPEEKQRWIRVLKGWEPELSAYREKEELRRWAEWAMQGVNSAPREADLVLPQDLPEVESWPVAWNALNALKGLAKPGQEYRSPDGIRQVIWADMYTVYFSRNGYVYKQSQTLFWQQAGDRATTLTIVYEKTKHLPGLYQMAMELALNFIPLGPAGKIVGFVVKKGVGLARKGVVAARKGVQAVKGVRKGKAVAGTRSIRGATARGARVRRPTKGAAPAARRGRKKLADEGLAAKRKMPDGHEIKITKDGRMWICSDPCDEARRRFASLIARDAEMARKLDIIEDIANPRKKARALERWIERAKAKAIGVRGHPRGSVRRSPGDVGRVPEEVAGEIPAPRPPQPSGWEQSPVGRNVVRRKWERSPVGRNVVRRKRGQGDGQK